MDIRLIGLVSLFSLFLVTIEINLQGIEIIKIDSGITNQMKNDAFSTARNALELFLKDSKVNPAEYVTTFFDEKYGGYWTCIIFEKKENTHSFFTYFDKMLIKFYIGDYYINLSKTSRK